jgi:16S rRNA (cytidine1402-2'-O)-methyltransferase
VARELTKVYEELARGTLSELALRFAEGARGEVTLVVEGAGADAGARPATSAGETEDLDRQIRSRLARGERAREIATALAESSGRPRREVYARVVALRGGGLG